jgi:uncharacterized protein involved in response to NO
MSRRIGAAEIGAEPFRVLFPAAVLAGIMGALLWPLHFWGVVPHYPGLTHARMMANGFFGGVIFGFLGTALPRVLGVPTLGLRMVAVLLTGHIGMAAFYFYGKIIPGDAIFLSLLILFLGCLAVRFGKREDLPPPSFALVLLALFCAAAGSGLSIWTNLQEEPNPRWISLQKLLSYQGLVLLPILGVGGFLLPRFFGLPPKRDLPESPAPTPEWKRGALLSGFVGSAIVASFFIEVYGWMRVAYAIRFGTALAFILLEIPVFRFEKINNVLALSLRLSFVCMLAGFACLIFWPAYRVGLLHLTLIGGFAIITFTVATRVILGHSGNSAMLAQPNRWFWIVVGMMLFGMATRISGDFWPKITMTHYTYGALLWAAAAVLWSARIFPKLLVADPES